MCVSEIVLTHSEKCVFTFGRDSVVATGWTVRGSNTGGGIYSELVHTGPGTHQAYYTMGNGSLLRVKRGFDHPPSPSAKVKERVEVYIYSRLGFRGLF
jgi:hypothetical protein